MSRSTKRALRMGVVSVVAGLLFAGCADNSTQESAGSTTFVIGLSSQPETLVRSFTSDAETATVDMAVHEGLVRTTKDKSVVPALAESWDISADGLTYTFHLRKGVTWHDGKPFTADDVVYSITDILPLSPTGAVLTATIESATATDDTTVALKLKKPFAPLLLSLGPQDFSIQPKHLYEGTDLLNNPANQAPIGTGPFKFDSVSGDTITLVANDKYWGGAPKIKKLIYKVIPDANSRANAMKSGEIDYINKFDVDSTIVKALENEPDVTLRNGRVSATFMTMWLNARSGPLADPKVRQALFTGLDRTLMSNSADPEFTSPAKGSFPDNIWAVDKTVDYLKTYKYDEDAAAELLDEAGFPAQDGGNRFSVRVRYVAAQPYTQALAAVVSSNWKSIGVDVQLIQDESAVNTDAVFKQNDFDVTFMSLDTRPDPELGIGRVYKCNPNNATFNNPTGYCNPELDDLFAQAAQAQDQDGRKELYAQAQAIIATDLPALTLLQMDQPDAIRSTFGGIDEFLSGALSGDLTWSALTP